MTKDRRVIACVAPRQYESFLRQRLGAAGYEVEFRIRGAPCESRQCDPFGIREVAADVKNDVSALILVMPRRAAPAMMAPGPVVEGLPVGLLPSQRPQDLEPWGRALTDAKTIEPRWAVLAMWRRSYLKLGNRFMRSFELANRGQAESWFADRVTRDSLCQKLASGPSLAIYLGHGRARGLCGYMGVRWQHVIQERTFVPCSTILSVACDTLKYELRRIPFGCRWVTSGRAASYVGAVDAVPIRASMRLAEVIRSTLATCVMSNLGMLLQSVDRILSAEPRLQSVHRSFQAYRIIGSPVAPL